MSAPAVELLAAIPVPENRWVPDAAAGLAGVDELVYRSNLLGADRALANRGGGNTSAKGVTVDHVGRETRTLWVKGSGTDLATIKAAGFAALRLDEILVLQERDAMDDAEMVRYLLCCALAPDQPRPSIETLLHAFLPAVHVDHTHPDAIIALTSCPDGRALARATFGDEAVWLDYERPGFQMSKRIAGLLRENPNARAVLLEKHGLVTWGESSAAAYGSTLEFVDKAARTLETAGDARFGLGGAKVRKLGDAEVETLLAESLPKLRGALLEETEGIVLHVDRSAEAIAFASSVRAPEVSQIGAPCPDHLISTKHKPLFVEFDPDRGNGSELGDAFRAGVTEYSDWYRQYYERNVTDESRPFPQDPAGPRVVLVPGVGIVTSGADAEKAQAAGELYHRAIAVQNAAEAAGGFRSLSELEAFGIEYWPLERYKLSQLPPARELTGRVALVTGGASGIGRAAARVLAELGAHIVVADLNCAGAEEVRAEICSLFGDGHALAVEVDVTNEEAVREMVRRAVLGFGGLDILVCSAGIASSAPFAETTLADWERIFAVLARGYFLPAREAFRVLIEQGRGGSIVFVGSKNALVAGANASAYSSAKAASLHLARCLAEEGGEHAIRVNTVNPDAVIEGSALWSSEWKADRASTYGIDAEDLPAFYRGRTRLGVNVYPDDVAEAIAFLAGRRSAKSTGNVINVDGGVTAAYPR
jgi:rhamnulose-1-phosphate aldolase/alcohol dehydrogenase